VNLTERRPTPPDELNLVLVGYRGCGKSSVGRALAARLNRTFVDTDERVEQASGCSIREIFEQNGEEEFRARERAATLEAAAHSRQVISVGGGAVLDVANRRALRERGLCVWLTAPPEELRRRLSRDENTSSARPPLRGQAVLAEIEQVLNERLPVYEAMADCVVDTRGKTAEQVADEIAHWLHERIGASGNAP
jgi:shikimate kinase